MTSVLYQNKGLLKGTQSALRVFTDSFPLDEPNIRMSFCVYDDLKQMSVMDQILARNETQNSEPTEVALYLDTPWRHLRTITVSCSEPLQIYAAEVPRHIQIKTEGQAVLVE
jgi:hypothetical protein